MPSRILTSDEVQRIAASKEARSPVVRHWPNKDDLELIAKAVNKRDLFVTLTSGVRYSIRYDSNYSAVFVKPNDGTFIPCGYLSYEKLKQALIEDE